MDKPQKNKFKCKVYFVSSPKLVLRPRFQVELNLTPKICSVPCACQVFSPDSFTETGTIIIPSNIFHVLFSLDEKSTKKIKAELCFSPLCQINDFYSNVNKTPLRKSRNFGTPRSNARNSAWPERSRGFMF